MNCAASKALLTLYVLNDLDEATAATVRTHLDSCSDCRAALQDIDSTLGLLRDALAVPTGAPRHLAVNRRLKALKTRRDRKPSVVVTHDNWFTRHHRGLAAAAALVFVLGTIGLLLPSLSSSREHARMTRFKMGEIVGSLDADSPPEPRKSTRYGFKAKGPRLFSRLRGRKSDVRLGVDLAPAETIPPPPASAPSDAGVLLEKVRNEGLERMDKEPSDPFETGWSSGPSPKPAEFDAVAITKSPVIVNGAFGNRSAGRRGQAISQYGGGAPQADDDVSVNASFGEVDDSQIATISGQLTPVTEQNWTGAGTTVPADPSRLVQAGATIVPATEGETTTYYRYLPKTEPRPVGKPTGDVSDGVPLLGDIPVAGSLGGGDRDGDAFSITAPPAKGVTSDAKKKDKESSRNDFVALDTSGVSKSGNWKEHFKEMGVKWPDSSSVKHVRTIGKLVVGGSEGKGLDDGRDLNGTPGEDIAEVWDMMSVVEKSQQEELARKLRTTEEKAKRGRKKAGEEARRREEEREEEEKRLRFKAHGVNPFVITRQEAFSTFGIDVDTASYTLTRNMMAQGALPPAEAVRTEEFVNAFDYGHVAPSHRTFRIYTELAPSPFGRGHQMLKIGIKGRRLGREEQRPAVLTFLVDTSGSMNAPERIGLVRTSLKLLVENLAPRDQVAVIQYDSHARLLLEHTPASNKAQILQAIDRMQCSGSTNLEEGMEEAYRLAAAAFIGGAENRVLLLSDGVANLGSIAAEDILDKVVTYRKQGIFCSVFGVGSGSYDDTMLETLANKGDGVYTFLDSEEQARRVFVDDLAATLNTIASDVKIQVEFNSMVVSQYRQLGYENRRLKKEDFRNDAVDAGEVGSGQAVTALYELSLLPQLLAKTRIDLPPRKLATVRVRYRRIDTGRVEEIEKAVWPRECLPVLERASHGFRLAAGVAEFAEILRGSPHAKGSAYEDVADVLRPVALELHLDRRVQELLQMVIAAESTPRGE